MGLWAPKSLQNHHCDECLLVLKVKKGVEPQFFGFRWITLLLSQEFLLPGGGLHHNDVICNDIAIV